MVKVDLLQREDEQSQWEEKGDACIMFVARETKTGKAYKVPEFRISKYDDIL